MQQTAAIYARYSTDEQRSTSLEDQIRRTTEKALALGYTVPQDLIFQDAAITGTAKGIEKRVSYHQFMKAWDDRRFDAIVVDELSRLARDNLELAKIQDRIEKSRVRLITTNGIDSSVDGWQLGFGFTTIISAHFVRETAHRVLRGMEGQLERGYFIGSAPYGYVAKRALGDAGTSFEIDEFESQFVKDIFTKRMAGVSLTKIAAELNFRNILPPRKSWKSTKSYWRPGTIYKILKNPIYRGVFIYNNSDYVKFKSQRDGKVRDKKEFLRPQLQIVTDTVWHACNDQTRSKRPRGGDKYELAGLFTCGNCTAHLSHRPNACPTLYCAQCDQAKRVGQTDRQAYYVSANGVKEMIILILQKLLTEDWIAQFRQRLRARLEKGNDDQLTFTTLQLKQVTNALERMLSLYSTIKEADEQIDSAITKLRSEKSVLIKQLDQLKLQAKESDKTVIEAQLTVNPIDLLPKLFDNCLPAHQVRAILSRIFTKLELLDKPDRWTSRFNVELKPGLLIAELMGSPILDTQPVEYEVLLKGGTKRPTEWLIQMTRK